MTGQLSFFDFPEVLPEESNPTNQDPFDEALWNLAYASVRGHITAGGESVDFIKKAYGLREPDDYFGINRCGLEISSIDYYWSKVVATNLNTGESRKYNWKQYVKVMKAMADKEKG